VDIFSTYSVKIKHYNRIFNDTVKVYREAVDFLTKVCLDNWEELSSIDGSLNRKSFIERLCHTTKNNEAIYDFDNKFYKFPSYLRRGAISEAIGNVSSYKSNLDNWKVNPIGKEPSTPKVGYIFPCLYRTEMYRTIANSDYKVSIKVRIRNTWDWIEVDLRKSDVDYIKRHCGLREECAPTLQKRGKEWYLDFPFKENVKLNDTPIQEQTIVAVDLGINSAATVSVMLSDGTILDRRFLKLSKEQDCLKHSVNRIKKAQQNRCHRTPRLWARAKGINKDISVKTANFIIEIATLYNADTIVFEHLDTSGRKKGFKRQEISLWKCREVQAMVTNKAHRLSMRVSTINAWGTSKLAFDGSGYVLRGLDAKLPTYSLCKFSNGKIYNCDLSASYNIGARYFIREILKSVPAKVRFELEAKVPQVTKRSTCTFSTLINLNAELQSINA